MATFQTYTSASLYTEPEGKWPSNIRVNLVGKSNNGNIGINYKEQVGFSLQLPACMYVLVWPCQLSEIYRDSEKLQQMKHINKAKRNP